MDSRLSKDQENAIEIVFEQNKGEVTAEQLLDIVKACGEDNPLYKVFEWDDTAAARQYRLSQARWILRASRVNFRPEGELETVQIRRTINLQASDEKMVYVRVEDALKSKEYVEQMKRQCENVLDSWFEKWRPLLGEKFVQEMLSERMKSPSANSPRSKTA